MQAQSESSLILNMFFSFQNFDGVIKSINNSRMTLDPEGNLWFSNVTRLDASDDFFYACSASSLFRLVYCVRSCRVAQFLNILHGFKLRKVLIFQHHPATAIMF